MSEALSAAEREIARELQTAILLVVSHQLRTPLTGIKASVTSLLQEDVDWLPEARREFLTTIDEETDRLNRIVGNLLDMSRLQTAALDVHLGPVDVGEALAAALISLGSVGSDFTLELPEALPRVGADSALLERAFANVLALAAARSRRDVRPWITAQAVNDGVETRVVDQGQRIPLAERERMFRSFDRLDDSDQHGVGLGLAVAKGLVEAMGGVVGLEDTPGGGLTVIVSLKRAG